MDVSITAEIWKNTPPLLGFSCWNSMSFVRSLIFDNATHKKGSALTSNLILCFLAKVLASGELKLYLMNKIRSEINFYEIKLYSSYAK